MHNFSAQSKHIEDNFVFKLGIFNFPQDWPACSPCLPGHAIDPVPTSCYRSDGQLSFESSYFDNIRLNPEDKVILSLILAKVRTHAT